MLVMAGARRRLISCLSFVVLLLTQVDTNRIQGQSSTPSPAQTPAQAQMYPSAQEKLEPYQYLFGNIFIPRASESEPYLSRFSLERGLAYLDQSSSAWNGGRKCVTCHTNGSYMTTRPAFGKKAGKAPEETQLFFREALKEQLAKNKEAFSRGLAATQVIYIAAGLADWDKYVTRTLSPETRSALSFMFQIQRETGEWTPPNTRWPPFESDSYHGATLAAIAVGTAPGWLKREAKTPDLRLGLQRLRKYLQTEPPPHDYGRVWLLRAATYMPKLLSDRQKRELVQMIWRHQQADGGWSIRGFAQPEQWGSGFRAAKLRGEADFGNPASDGHQTGLAIVALREAGVPANDPRIQKGVRWLLSHQRESGRWWTRSLNNDRWHFITLSGTGYALLALSLCDELS